MLMAGQLRNDSIALTEGLLIAVSAALSQRACPLRLLRSHLSHRERHSLSESII